MPFPGAGGGGSSTVCEPCCAPATLAVETLTADIFLGTAVCTGFPNVAGSHELHFTNLTFNNSSFVYQGHTHSDQCKFVQNNGSNCCVVIVSCLDEVTAQVDGYYYDALGNVLHFLNQLTNPCVIDGVSLSCVACSGFDAGCCAAALSGTMFLSVN